MTNEEARNILSQYDTSPIIEMYWTDGEQIPSDNVYEALDLAIKALETPSNDNWEGYSERLWKNAYERGKADAIAETHECDCISRESVLKEILSSPAWHNSDGSYYHSDDIKKAVDSLPSVTPNENKGKWIKESIEAHNYIVECSECGYSGNEEYKFCPMCGADMRGDKDADSN